MAVWAVILGPVQDGFCPGLVVTPLDADALRSEGCVQVELAYRGGDLRDALTLRMTEEYVHRRGQGDAGIAWAYLSGFLAHTQGVEKIEVATPIPST